MGANERLSLQIDGKATGTAEIEKLAGALNKVVDISAKIGQRKEGGGEAKTGFEGFPEKIKSLVEDPLSSAQGVIGKFTESFGAVGAISSGAVAGLAAFAAISQETARHLAELGVSVRDVSLKTGLSIEDVGKFGFAAQSVGKDVGIFEGGMRKLSQALADNGPEGDKAREGLSKLGVTTRELNGDLKPTSDIFEQISEGLKGLGSAAERNAEVVKIFGRGGIELIPVLDRLNERLERVKELNAEWKIGITNADVEKYEKIKDKLTDIDYVWSGLKRKLEEGIVGKISFVLGEVRNAVAKAIVGNGEGPFAHFMDFPGIPQLGEARDTSLKPAPIEKYTIDSINQGAALFANGGFQRGAYSMRAVNGTDSIAAATSRISGDESSFGFTLAGAQSQASKARSDAEAARTGYFGLKGQGGGAASIEEARKKWVQAEAAAKSYEERAKSLQLEESKIEGGRNGSYFKELQAGAAQLGGTGEDEFTRINSEYAKQSSDEKLKYLPAGQRQTVMNAQRLARDRALQVLRKKLTDEAAKGFADVGDNREGVPDILAQGTRAMDSIFGVGMGNVNNKDFSPLRLGLPAQATPEDLIKNLHSQTEHQVRMASIAGGPGDEVAVAQKIGDIKTAAENQSFKLAQDHAKILLDQGVIDKQALFDLEMDHQRQLTEIEQADEEMLAQLRKQRMDEETTAVTGLVRAAMGGGKSVVGYLKGFAMDTGEKVLSNILQSPSVSGKMDKFFPSLGPNFKGTLFGPKIPSAIEHAGAGAAGSPSATLTSAGASLQKAAADLTAAANALQGKGPGGTASSTDQIAGTLGVDNNGNLVIQGVGGAPPPLISGSGEGGYEGSNIPGSYDNSSGETGPVRFGSSFGYGLPGSSMPGVSGNIPSDIWNTGGSGSGEAGSEGSNIPGSSDNSSGESGDQSLADYSIDPNAPFNAASKTSGFGFNAGTIGKLGAAGAGIFQAVQGFSEGGARNAASGVGGVLGSAAAITSMIPGAQIATPFLAAGAGLADLTSMLLPNPKAARENFINKAIGNAKYEAPESINESMGLNGGYSDVSAFGTVRSSDLSPNPTGIVQPSQWYRGGVFNQVPGSSGTPYGAPMSQTTIQINALDSQSIMDRGADIAAALVPQFGTNTALSMAATKATVVG